MTESITLYISRCTECGRKRKTEGDCGSEYICKSCIKEMKEPVKNDWEEFDDFIERLENYINITNKKTKYDMYSDKFKKDVYEFLELKDTKLKSIYDKMWEYCENHHDSHDSRTSFISEFKELTDLLL